MKRLDDPALEIAARSVAVIRNAIEMYDRDVQGSPDRHSDRCACPICHHVAELRRLVHHGVPPEFERADRAFLERVAELQTVLAKCDREARELLAELARDTEGMRIRELLS